MRSGGLRGEPVERVPGGDELERAGCGKRHRRRDRPARSSPDDRVPELAGAAGGAAVDPPAEHDPAAHAGPDREHHEVVRDQSQLLVVGLRQRRDGRVVVDEHRHAEPLAEHRAQRHVGRAAR